MIPFSVLDLSPITQGSTPAQSLRNTLDLARHAESLGFNRYWLAEHHSMPGIASAATSVVIGHVAAGTSRIRVGATGTSAPGGISAQRPARRTRSPHSGLDCPRFGTTYPYPSFAGARR